MKDLRENVGIAIDGGGIRGIIIARALQALQDELKCKELIKHPKIKLFVFLVEGINVFCLSVKGRCRIFQNRNMQTYETRLKILHTKLSYRR